MAVIVDQLAELELNYSPLQSSAVGYISESQLSLRARAMKPPKRSPRLTGKKTPKETGHFFRHAQAFATIANEHRKEHDEEVVAVYFRDSDGTASAGRGLWEDQRASMLRGFQMANFQRGVPMIPKPKSEAWLLCALKAESPYQNCGHLELRSGNDRSPNALKDELAGILNQVNRSALADLVRNHNVNATRIDMPSYNRFREDLQNAIGFGPPA